VDGASPIGRAKKTWRVIVEKDCQARKLKREDAVDKADKERLTTMICVSG